MAACQLQAQVPVAYRSGSLWGYTLHGRSIIPPQYDTAFPFDPTGSVAMVGKVNPDLRKINLLTGAEEAVTDYYFINPRNAKFKLHWGPEDSVIAFPQQQELSLNYLSTAPFFKLLYDHKVWLFSKQGRQRSSGYDDLYMAGGNQRFFITETYAGWGQDIVRLKGLIDTSGHVLVNCEKKQIHINQADSLIYTCSTIFNRGLSDEVFDYKGKIIYSNKHHIEYAARNLYVYKRYEPRELYMVSNGTKDLYGIEGVHFYDLGQDKALIVGQDDGFLVHLPTGKKQKVKQETWVALMAKWCLWQL